MWSTESIMIEVLRNHAVADPGFSRGGGVNSKGGREKLLFGQFFSQKLHEIERISEWQHVSLAPPPTLRCANEMYLLILRHSNLRSLGSIRT